MEKKWSKVEESEEPEGRRAMYGRYDHAVDPKGRLFVPAKLRAELGDAFYVTVGLDHCLLVYPQAGWDRILAKLDALSLTEAAGMRVLLANVARCEPDKQGRFLLPAALRRYAGLGQEVMFLGQGSRAEIWDTAAYEALEAAELTPEKLRAVMEELNF